MLSREPQRSERPAARFFFGLGGALVVFPTQAQCATSAVLVFAVWSSGRWWVASAIAGGEDTALAQLRTLRQFICPRRPTKGAGSWFGTAAGRRLASARSPCKLLIISAATPGVIASRSVTSTEAGSTGSPTHSGTYRRTPRVRISEPPSKRRHHLVGVCFTNPWVVVNFETFAALIHCSSTLS